MQKKRIFFPFGESQRTGSRLGQIPNFYQKFVLKASLMSAANCKLQTAAHGKSHWLLTTRVQQLASKIWRFSRNQHFLRTLRLGSSKIWRFSCNQHLLRTWTQEKNLVRNSGARFLQILFSKIWRLSCNQHLLRTYTLEKNLVKYFGSKISSNVVDFLARFLQMLLII